MRFIQLLTTSICLLLFFVAGPASCWSFREGSVSKIKNWLGYNPFETIYRSDDKAVTEDGVEDMLWYSNEDHQREDDCGGDQSVDATDGEGAAPAKHDRPEKPGVSAEGSQEGHVVLLQTSIDSGDESKEAAVQTSAHPFTLQSDVKADRETTEKTKITPAAARPEDAVGQRRTAPKASFEDVAGSRLPDLLIHSEQMVKLALMKKYELPRGRKTRAEQIGI